MQLHNSLREEITKLSQEQCNMDAPPTPESCGSVMDGYNPCLPMPALESELLGIGVAKEKLASLLLGLDGEKQLKVVSIVGFAGLGKTTLAMEVYRQTREAFECHATAIVSRNPNIKQLLQHILSQVRQEPNSPQDSEEMSLEPEQLIAEIREHLQYKRYLILLDDMWESSLEIKRAFHDNNCGSRIIMTTRIKCLADGVVYEMERLCLAESENLLCREIYGSRNGCLDKWKEDSYETARTYDGVPLATIAIAHLVKERLKSHIYPVVKVPEEAHAEKRILLSYIDLKPCLKAHMMLLCMFPWNFQIDRNLIIRLWSAEGLANSGSREESIAEEILDGLINRNVILPVNHEDISQLEAWKVYYVMFEAILLHSAKENFLLTSSKLQLETTSRVPRLALHSYNPQLEERLQQVELRLVSSLSIFWMANRISLDKFRSLRVLDILGWKHLKDEDLEHICKMHFLRYLSLRNTSVRIIPKNIYNLRHLETLDLRKTRVTELPSQVGELPKLSDLLVGSDQDPSSNARVRIPMGFRYFRFLRTLETIHLSDAWLLLNSLQHLKEISIMCPSKESSYSQKKLCRSLKQCRELMSLTFYGGQSYSVEFLNSLHDPPRGLHKLRVTGTFIKIPQWIGTLENLVLLQIKVCWRCDLQYLGKLRRLKHLFLGLDYLLEHDLVITGFPALERFSVDCRTPWLNFQPRAMPNLTELELKFREGPVKQETRNTVPTGIHHLLNLKRIAIYYSSWYKSSPSVKATVDAIVTAVREHRGPVKLFINGSTDIQDIIGEQAMIR